MIEEADLIAQLFIAITGIASLWLVGSLSPEKRMYAGLFGMMGEPFWFVTAAINNQWGIVVLATAYSFSWYRVYSNNRKQYLLKGAGHERQ